MKISLINNAELVIQARNEDDYKQAMQVAERIQANTDKGVVVCSADDWEQWIHLTTNWDWFQAADLKDQYQIAKSELNIR